MVLKVYDILGNEVTTLVNEQKEPGYYEVDFSATGGSASGRNAFQFASGVSATGGYASGVYIYRLQTGNYISTKKMLMLK
ncbi:MAG: hypothetical protein Q8M94_09455 [Ignavibacteria bacterium]|nr:hypothetical protein [Ignavibacteria bacterium]